MATYITRTATGNNNSVGKWTFSCWIKRTKIDYESNIISFFSSNTLRSALRFDGDNKIRFFEVNGSTIVTKLSNKLFRDTSAWYHIVFAVDKTVSSPDTQIYVNGEAITSWSTDDDYTQNESGTFNNAVAININAEQSGTGIGECLLSHVHFIDGTKYQASDFGETDSTTGEWKIKTSPSVTYGTNGFFILKDGNSLTDQSGNSNNFTVATGTLTNTEDNPSNVFATLNAVYKAAYQPTFSTGNLTATAPNSGQYYPAFSSLGIETGKFYMEYKIGAAGTFHIGICSENDANTVFPTTDNYIGESSKSVGISDGNGSYYISGSATSYGSSYTSGDIIGLALDMTNKKLYVSKNGTFFNSANPASGTGGIDISGILSSGDIAFFAHSCYGGTGTRAIEANFGNGFFGTTAISSEGTNASGIGKFEYDVPTGYTALSTKGLNE